MKYFYGIWLFMLSLSLSACTKVQPQASQDTNNVRVPSASEIMANNDGDQAFIQKLKALQQRDPSQDARNAIAQGKRYFLCNAGRSKTVPGLNRDVYAKAQQHCPTRCLDGVTDALYGPHHSQYLSAALTYSARWNQVMLGACL
ncbi:MAG: hypothetical protein CR991_06620 [Proteobacteria bacterium]|nr:MAG: hypothetical protein CR991_06620 [Pseudomonadota bacterium]